MRTDATSFWGWQQRYSDEKSCLHKLIKLRWPDGFKCGHCGHAKGWLLQTRHVHECAGCHRHTSLAAGTVFHNTKLPLVKWFWRIYWVSTDKGGISALRLAKLVGVSWVTAHRMLRKLRVAMGDQNRLCRLEGIIELGDAFVGGIPSGAQERSGKRGRGADGRVDQNTVKAFAQEAIAPGQTLHTDAFTELRVLAEDHHHAAKAAPAELVDEWLPWVHIVISNFKSFVLGTYHGISRATCRNTWMSFATG